MKVSCIDKCSAPYAGVRVDTWVETGTEVTPHYDSLLAKLMVHALDRAGATAALQKALAATELGGIATNLDYVATIAGSQGFAAGAGLGLGFA